MKAFIFIFFTLKLSTSYAGIQYDLVGNTKTDNEIINTEINDILDKDSLEERDIVEIKRRIWNLRIFSNVQVIKLTKNKIKITVEERWTTIPIAKFSGGGGSSYYALGVYDINSFGKNKELGAQYESLNNRPAGVIWTRHPQFLKNRNLNFGADIWSINRVRMFYDQKTRDNIGALTLERKRFNIYTEVKWDQDFYRFGFQYDYHYDIISDFGLSDEQIEINRDNGLDPDSENINRWHTFYFDIGRLNYTNYLLSGSVFSIKTSLVNITAEKEEYLSSHEVSFKYFKLFNNHHNFGWNFRIRSHNISQIQNLNYIGGFEEVRGYMDGQYYGNSSWQNNLEYRLDLYSSSKVVLQGAIFSDQGKVGESLEHLTKNKDEILLSSGFGIRFISPKIFRFVGRLDFAQTHTRSVSHGISFGIQQFF